MGKPNLPGGVIVRNMFNNPDNFHRSGHINWSDNLTGEKFLDNMIDTVNDV